MKLTWVQLPGCTELIQSLFKSALCVIPHLNLSQELGRTGRQLQLVIEPGEGAKL